MQTKLAAQVKLASRAQKLSRRIYISLPFAYRFGELMDILSDSHARLMDALGRTFYAEFLKAGVEMPAISGKPAEEYLDKVRSRGADALPRGYGGRFARMISTWIRSKFLIEADADEFIQDLLVMLLKGRFKVEQSKAHDLKSAESFALRFVDWRMKDWEKRRSRRSESAPEMSLTQDTGGQLEIRDMSGVDLRDLLNRLRPAEGEKLMQELRRVDPRFPNRAEEWIVSKLEGTTGRELAEEWGITEGRVSQWITRFLPKMQDVFARYFPYAVAV
jgi:RNA polymerase sigma factor (sigma-70 family)